MPSNDLGNENYPLKQMAQRLSPSHINNIGEAL